MRNQSNNFLLDGASNNDSFNTGFVLRPPPDAIQEFKILTHSYDAEYGRNAGSVVNVVTKSGTNDWHGSAWEFNRDDALQAKNFFATTQAGAEAEPVRRRGSAARSSKNRLFMFSYYEGFNNKQGTTDTRDGAVAGAAQRRFLRRRGDPRSADRTAVPRQRDPRQPDQPDREARSSTKYIPLPNSDAQPRRAIAKRRGHARAVRHAHRLPAQRRSTALLGRYMVGHTDNVNPLGGSNFSPAGNTAIATLQDIMGSDTWILKPNMINVARASMNRISAKPTVTSGLQPEHDRSE